MKVEFVMLKQNFDFINRALIFNRKKFYVKQIQNKSVYVVKL